MYTYLRSHNIFMHGYSSIIYTEFSLVTNPSSSTLQLIGIGHVEAKMAGVHGGSHILTYRECPSCLFTAAWSEISELPKSRHLAATLVPVRNDRRHDIDSNSNILSVKRIESTCNFYLFPKIDKQQEMAENDVNSMAKFYFNSDVDEIPLRSTWNRHRVKGSFLAKMIFGTLKKIDKSSISN